MMKDENQQNKKANKPKRSKDTEGSLDAEAKEIIRKAMLSSLKEKANGEQGLKRDLKSLSCVVEEFLSSFIILGYSFDGEPIHCIYAKTQQEADSLVTLINKFFNTHLNDEDREQG